MSKLEQPELVPAVRAQAQHSAISIIAQMASDPACDPAKLRELLAVRRDWEADEARKAFNAAVGEFQRKCPVVGKLDSADGKHYAKLDRIWRAIRPTMEACGLSVTWESTTIQPGEICYLRGHLRHSAGHAEPLEYQLPIPKAITTREGRTVQNAAQVMGAATTYAKRYATCAALGVQTGEDTDACVDQGSVVTDLQLAQLERWCTDTKTQPATICTWAGVQRLIDFPASKFQEAAVIFKQKGAK